MTTHLCSTHDARWHSLLQYVDSEHPAQRLRGSFSSAAVLPHRSQRPTRVDLDSGGAVLLEGSSGVLEVSMEFSMLYEVIGHGGGGCS